MSDKVLGIISSALKAAEQDVDQTYDGLARAVALALSAAGYAVVPREPTEAMEDAGSEAYWDMRGGTPAPNNKNSIGELIVCAYKAMLAAALAGRKP